MDEQTDGQTDGQAANIMPPTASLNLAEA